MSAEHSNSTTPGLAARSLESLPEEILAKIVRYANDDDEEYRLFRRVVNDDLTTWQEEPYVVPRKRSIRTLSLVSHRLRRLAVPYLFAGLDLRTLPTEKVLEQVGTRYGTWIRRLVLPSGDGPFESPFTRHPHNPALLDPAVYQALELIVYAAPIYRLDLDEITACTDVFKFAERFFRASSENRFLNVGEFSRLFGGLLGKARVVRLDPLPDPDVFVHLVDYLQPRCRKLELVDPVETLTTVREDDSDYIDAAAFDAMNDEALGRRTPQRILDSIQESFRKLDLEGFALQGDVYINKYLPRVGELDGKLGRRLWPNLREIRLILPQTRLTPSTRDFISHFAETLEKLELKTGTDHLWYAGDELADDADNEFQLPLFSRNFSKLRQLAIAHSIVNLGLDPGEAGLEWPPVEDLSIETANANWFYLHNVWYAAGDWGEDDDYVGAAEYDIPEVFLRPFARTLRSFVYISHVALARETTDILVSYCEEHKIRLAAPISLYDPWARIYEYREWLAKQVVRPLSRSDSLKVDDFCDDRRDELLEVMPDAEEELDEAVKKQDCAKLIGLLGRAQKVKDERAQSRSPWWNHGPNLC
ncbi:hypothetical protein JCM10212_005218 [Sporobolomyces blumeae]